MVDLEKSVRVRSTCDSLRNQSPKLGPISSSAAANERNIVVRFWPEGGLALTSLLETFSSFLETAQTRQIHGEMDEADCFNGPYI